MPLFDRASARLIEPGVYKDDRGSLHICLEELLTANGYTDTPENRETMIRAFREHCLSEGVQLEIEHEIEV